MRITKRLVGQTVNFRGYDDKTYRAVVLAVGPVAGGMAKLAYTVSVGGESRDVVAYVHDSARLSLVDGGR